MGWYIYRNDEVIGPFEKKEIQSFEWKTADTQICPEGTEDWRPLSSDENFTVKETEVSEEHIFEVDESTEKSKLFFNGIKFITQNRPMMFVALIIMGWGVHLFINYLFTDAIGKHIVKGQKYIEERNYQSAETEFLKAVKEREKSFLAHYYLGKVYFLQGKNDDAVRELKRAQEIKPNDKRPQEILVIIEIKKINNY